MAHSTSITARILEPRLGDQVVPGSAYHWLEPDLILGHEATIALLIQRLRASGRPIFDPSRCFFAADHFVPPATAERAGILKQYLEFVAAEGVPEDALFRGISHQLLVEDRRCVPGAVIAGADSHTTMAGALGAFAAGFGSTDIFALLATGKVAIRVPEATRVTFSGSIPRAIAGKDLALVMMRHFGEGGGSYRALEFSDQTRGVDSEVLPGIDMAGRMTLCNMAVDCGAKNGLFEPDDVTAAFVRARDGIACDAAMFEALSIGADSAYQETLEFDISDLEPLVARPGSTADVVRARDLPREPIHQAFIGSCAGGRLEDLRDAAAILRGRRVRPSIRLVVTPASQKVYLDAMAEGLIQDLVASGAMVTASACGACGGIDKGLLADGEVCVSTSNRNFRGRMGHENARIYLASARTAAASALAGYVVDPREFMS